VRPSRRALVLGGAAGLCGCANLGPPPLPRPSREADLGILQSLLGLEWQIVAVYCTFEEGLQGDAAQRAATFRAEHERHAEIIAASIERLGGEREETSRGPLPRAADRVAALRILAAEERWLASAYLGAVPAFADRDLARAAGSLLAVETMHWSAWRAALGEPPTDGPVFPSG
jgi:hypothetical protein